MVKKADNEKSMRLGYTNMYERGAGDQYNTVVARLRKIVSGELVHFHNFHMEMIESQNFVQLNVPAIEWVARHFGGNDIQELETYVRDNSHLYVTPCPTEIIPVAKQALYRHLQGKQSLQDRWVQVISGYTSSVDNVQRRQSLRRAM